MPITLHTTNTFVGYNYPIKEAQVLFLGVPFVSTSISKPALYGPVMVRESLKYFNGNHNKVDVFEKLRFCDLGEIDIVAGNYEKTAERIHDTVAEVKNENKEIFPIFIGGEHLVTLPITEALKPKTIIQFDSHPDLTPVYQESVVHSHATWAYHASKLAKLIQIGVTNYMEEDDPAIKENGVVVINTLEDLEKSKLEKPIHLSIDVDVLKPVHVETGFPEGKMEPEQLFAFLEKIECDSLDIVEIADDRLPSKTGFLAAEIIMRVLAKRFRF